MTRWLLVAVFLILPLRIFGQVTYFLSPTGSDAANGTSVTAPWKTFTKAIPALRAGDILMLMDGIFPPVTIDCAANAQKGAATAPITVKALNQRRALILGNGAGRAVNIRNCSAGFWTLDGLRIENQDNPAYTLATADVIEFYASSNSTLRNSIVRHPNRYGNNSVVSVYVNSTYITIEDNEVLDFHRNGITPISNDVQHITLRRNYINPQGAKVGAAYQGPNDAIIMYWSVYSTIENNISEGADGGIGNQGAGNRFFGNIALGNRNGFVDSYSYGATANSHSRDALWVNNISVGNLYNGHFARSPLNSTIRNLSVFGGRSNGVIADNYYDVRRNDPIACNGKPCTTQLAPALTVANTLVVGTASGYVLGNASEFAARVFKFSHGWANANGTWRTGTATRDTATTPPTPPGNVDAGLGACRVFVPDGSPMRRRGENGADIGANVLYRYQDGVLTTVPLWNPVTGEFPHGAVIAGVNDAPGKNVFDVHKRLNVNANGCTLPSWYGGARITPSPTPTVTATPIPTPAFTSTLTPTPNPRPLPGRP